MLSKNTASQGIYLYAWNVTTGKPDTGDSANITGSYTLDGTDHSGFATANPTEIGGGIYWQPLAQGETNGNAIAYRWVSSTAGVIIQPVFVLTTGTSLPAAAPAASGGLLTVGTGAGQIGPDGTGAVPVAGDLTPTMKASVTAAVPTVAQIQSGLATPTNITAGTITTVTNLTNAPSAGDFTAAMKASLNASTPASIQGVTNIVSAGPITTSSGKVSEVALVDTLTTYTGNTPQTADVGNLIPARLVMTAGQVWALDSSGNPLATHADAVALSGQIGTPQQDGSAVTLPANPPAGFLVAASYGTAPAWYSAPVDVSAAVDAIKAQTDQLGFTTPGALDSNVLYVHNIEVTGSGTPAAPWARAVSSAWGASWGLAWGNSWGQVGGPPAPEGWYARPRPPTFIDPRRPRFWYARRRATAWTAPRRTRMAADLVPQTLTKQQSEVLLRGFDFSEDPAIALQGLALAGTPVVTVTAGDGALVAVFESLAANAKGVLAVVNVLFSGGTAGTDYELGCSCQTTGSPVQTLEMQGVLHVSAG